MNSIEFQNIINESKSKSEVCRKLGISVNGRGYVKYDKLKLQHNVDDSILRKNLSKSKQKYDIIIKTCPVCETKFTTKKNHISEKTTCSHSCSNTFFRSGIENPNWKDDSYRSTCFLHHEKKCIICSEINIVEVHHYDMDNTNNNPDNLIPMCPTHHQYFHSGFRNEVEVKINTYRNKFIQSRC